MDDHTLAFRFGFVDDPPVTRAQLEESFPVPAEREWGNLFEVFHKPFDPVDNSPLDRTIQFCQVLFGLRGNQKPPASHLNSLLIFFENLGKFLQLPFPFGFQRLLKPEGRFPAQD